MPHPTKQQENIDRWTHYSSTAGVICPVRTTLNLLGGKWKLLLLYSLLDGPRRYGELRRQIPEITEKMLVQELRALEADGLVARTVYHQVPPKVEYALVGPGERVRPVLQALLGWSTDYLMQQTAASTTE